MTIAFHRPRNIKHKVIPSTLFQLRDLIVSEIARNIKRNMKKLAVYKPLWIEEPTNCDDIVGHREIAKALAPFGVGVATGEVAQNKIIFKQLLQEDAIEFCQIDSCRIAGPCRYV